MSRGMVKLHFSLGRPGILLQECGGTTVIGCQPPSRRRRGSTWGDHHPPSPRDGASMKAAWVPLGSWLPRGISSDLQWQRDEAPLARGGGDQWGVSAMVLMRATGGLRSLKLCWLPPWNLVRRLIEGPVLVDTATGWRIEGVPSTCIGSKLKGLDSSCAKVRQRQELGADLSTSWPGRSLMGFSPPTNITG